jgi:hypothetical protein
MRSHPNRRKQQSRRARQAVGRAAQYCLEPLETRRLFSNLIPATFYVDHTATGMNNGGNWANAFTSLQTALQVAYYDEYEVLPGDPPFLAITIDVAQGTYYPTTGTNRAATFSLIDNVVLDGGFANGGSATADPAEHPTILSGAIGAPGTYADNSYHVVTGDGVDSSAGLDGFTITAGNATYAPYSNDSPDGGGLVAEKGDPVITNCIFTHDSAEFGGGILISFAEFSAPIQLISNCTFIDDQADDGGGIYISGNSYAVLRSCDFEGDSADYGGAMDNAYSSNTAMANCVFSGNYSSVEGGAIFNMNSAPLLTNCTFAANVSGRAQSGGAFYVLNTGQGDPLVPVLDNCILWGDIAGDGPDEIATYGPSGTTAHLSVNYSDVDQAGYSGIHNDIDADPNFIRNPLTLNSGDFGDLSLQGDSLAINSGSNTDLYDAAFVGGYYQRNASTYIEIPSDIQGDPRVVDHTVDMGAYEYQHIPSTLYVDQSAVNGANNGSSWGNAFLDLQSALAVARPGATIDVAEGTYYPTPGTDSLATFELQNYVAIDGGFASGGSSTANPLDYPTILSGDIGNGDKTSFNSYHVVTGNGVNSSAVLDGFTIMGGDADGGAADNYGAGLDLDAASPTVVDCTFLNNTAESGGSAIDDSDSSYPAVTDCQFDANYTLSGDGGAVEIDQSSGFFVNCIFDSNSAAGTGYGSGGAVYNDNDSFASFINCTLAGNSASAGAGAIFNQSSSTSTLTNCIIYSNSALTGGEISSDATSSSLVTFCDIDQSAPEGLGHYYAYDDIDADPQFFRNPKSNGPSDLGNLRLRAGSPAINIGSNAAINATGATTDIEGNTRILGGSVDTGAYEFGTVWTGLGDGMNWTDPANWSTNLVPTQYDGVTIGSGFSGVQLPAGTLSVYSLNSQSPLTILSGAELQLLSPSVISGPLTIQPGGALDITNASLAVDYGVGNPSPLSQMEGYLASGAILSSVAQAHPGTAVGYADGSVDSNTAAQPGQVLLQYTLAGDANLDGKVNFIDLLKVAQNFNKTGEDWAGGDFVYNPTGLVNFADLLLVAQNFQKVLNPAAATAQAAPVATIPLPEVAVVASLPASVATKTTVNKYPAPATPAPFTATNDSADSLLQSDIDRRSFLKSKGSPLESCLKPL